MLMAEKTHLCSRSFLLLSSVSVLIIRSVFVVVHLSGFSPLFSSPLSFVSVSIISVLFVSVSFVSVGAGSLVLLVSANKLLC